MIKLILDPGHGGDDPGAIGHGLQEKDIVLKMAKKIQQLLQAYEGLQIKLTRTTDVFLSLSERSNIANDWNADFFLSLHINAHNDTRANGFETYIYNGSVGARTVAFQNQLHPAIMKKIDFEDRGKKKANFSVLRRTNASAILTESGFISNASNASKLKDDSYLDQLAKGHVDGIVQFLGLKKKETAKETAKTNDLFRVQVGAFSSLDNAERLVDALRKQGYKDAFIVK